jgi:carbon monoxide dehydrogenase subunit G
MKLAFSGAPEIHATRDQVWRRILDPRFVAQSAPGMESVDVLGENRFRMNLGFGVALLKFHFALDVGFHDIVPQEHARMEARGSAPGTTVAMDSRIRLEQLDPARQRLHWSAETVVDGALAGVGARLVEGVARRLTERFWEDFARRVEEER